jgi:hypothetical protein
MRQLLGYNSCGLIPGETMRTNAAVFVLVLASAAAAQDSRSPQKSPPSANPANSTLSPNWAVITNQDVLLTLGFDMTPVHEAR